MRYCAVPDAGMDLDLLALPQVDHPEWRGLETTALVLAAVWLLLPAVGCEQRSSLANI